MKQSELNIFDQISNAFTEQTATSTQAIPVGAIGFSGAIGISNDQIFDFDPTLDVLLIDGEPVNENGLPSGVHTFENHNGDTVVQFSSGETQTLHGASYDDFLDFIDDISINAAADFAINTPENTDTIEADVETGDFIGFDDDKTLPLSKLEPETQFGQDDDQDDLDNIFLF